MTHHGVHSRQKPQWERNFVCNIRVTAAKNPIASNAIQRFIGRKQALNCTKIRGNEVWFSTLLYKWLWIRQNMAIFLSILVKHLPIVGWSKTQNFSRREKRSVARIAWEHSFYWMCVAAVANLINLIFAWLMSKNIQTAPNIRLWRCLPLVRTIW